MTYREFEDPEGELWEAWEVRPAAIERRQQEDRRRLPRQFGDRRLPDFQLKLIGGMRDGWLTFQRGAERRRLSPIPEGWAHLPDETLLALTLKAVPVTRAGLSPRVSGFGEAPSPGPAVPDPEPDLF